MLPLPSFGLNNGCGFMAFPHLECFITASPFALVYSLGSVTSCMRHPHMSFSDCPCPVLPIPF